METISSKKNKTKKVVSKSVKFNKKAVKSGEDKIKISKNEAPKKKFFRRKARATIYIGHIPHGFYESEMTSYFTQFGKVLKATVARSKNTGRSKGYGFVEFENEEVAKIAAETMNNYLMFNRIIKCRYIPPEERKGRRLTVIDPKNYPKKLNRNIDLKTKNEAISKLDQQTYLKKAEKKINQFKKFFEEEGIDFNFKLNSPDSSNNEEKNKANNSNDVESESNTSSKSDDDTDKEFGVLEIDESDNEIHFKTPPQVKKVIKRSLNSPLLSSKRRKGSQNSKIVEKIEKKSSRLQNSSKEPPKKQETKKKSNVNKSKLLNLKAPENQETKKSNVNKSKLLKLKAPENQETKKSNVNKSKLLKLKAPQVKTTQKTNQKKLNLKSKNVVKCSKKI